MVQRLVDDKKIIDHPIHALFGVFFALFTDIFVKMLASLYSRPEVTDIAHVGGVAYFMREIKNKIK